MSGNEFKEPIEYIYNNYCVNDKGEKNRQIFVASFSLSAYMIVHYLG